MEIEFKYRIDDPETAEKIFMDPEIVEITDHNSEETIDMHAIYFDTEDRRLSREGITMRTRREGDFYVATLKWNGGSEKGLHQREELNIPMDREDDFKSPNPEIFSQTPMYPVLTTVIGKRELLKRVEVKVMRRQIRVDTGESICEISYDNGIAINGDKIGDISEMEIELYSGSKENMEEFGEKLAEKYGLLPENRSKFRQGLDLNP